MDFHNPVFPISTVAILAFVFYALVYPAAANSHLTAARGWSIEHFDGLFMIAGILLSGGGSMALGALQAGAVAIGLPFTLMLLVMAYSLVKGLVEEQRILVAIRQAAV